MTLILAHRTCPRETDENSLAGIATAAALGADGVEIDVRLTRDRVAVLMHDRTAWRTARSPCPVSWTPSGRWRHRRLRRSGAPPPTLLEALDALPPAMTIAIDIKVVAAVDAVIAAVREHELGGRALPWCREPESVRRLATALPDCECALLRDSFNATDHSRYLDDALACGARAVSLHQDALLPDVLDGASARGLAAYTWLQSLEHHDRHAGIPLAGVVTDWPTEAATRFPR